MTTQINPLTPSPAEQQRLSSVLVDRESPLWTIPGTHSEDFEDGRQIFLDDRGQLVRTEFSNGASCISGLDFEGMPIMVHPERRWQLDLAKMKRDYFKPLIDRIDPSKPVSRLEKKTNSGENFVAEAFGFSDLPAWLVRFIFVERPNQPNTFNLFSHRNFCGNPKYLEQMKWEIAAAIAFGPPMNFFALHDEGVPSTAGFYLFKELGWSEETKTISLGSAGYESIVLRSDLADKYPEEIVPTILHETGHLFDTYALRYFCDIDQNFSEWVRDDDGRPIFGEGRFVNKADGKGDLTKSDFILKDHPHWHALRASRPGEFAHEDFAEFNAAFSYSWQLSGVKTTDDFLKLSRSDLKALTQIPDPPGCSEGILFKMRQIALLHADLEEQWQERYPPEAVH